jgi:Apea-like HEPN
VAFDKNAIVSILGRCSGASSSEPLLADLPPWLERERIKTPPQLLADLVAALKEQEELAIFDDRMQQIVDGAFRANLEQLAHWLIRRAARVGPENAVEDLRRYVSSDKYEVEETCLLDGVTIAESIEVADGISLIPFQQLPDSRHKEMFTPTMWNYRLSHPRAALTCKTLYPKHHGAEMVDLIRRQDEFADIVLVLTLIGPGCPVVIASWTRALDWVPMSDHAIASSRPFGAGQAKGIVDLSTAETEKLRSLYSLFKNLPSDERRHLRVPLDRLNRASRWTDRTTAAIELGIAFEALLLNDLDDDRGELSVRLRLRGARLLGKTLDERIKIDRLLRSVYKARSIAVHTGNLPERIDGLPTHEILDDGQRLAARAIETILHNGGSPDWRNIVLG